MNKVKRDWLFRPNCPLCLRPVESDKVLVLGHPRLHLKHNQAWPQSQEEKDEISRELCWGCVLRCHSWMSRLGRNHSYTNHGVISIRESDILEFTAHVMISKPKWFQSGKSEWNAPIAFNANGVKKCLARFNARHPDSVTPSLESLMRSVMVRAPRKEQVQQQD